MRYTYRRPAFERNYKRHRFVGTAAGAPFITPTGIASGESFGTLTITLYVEPTGIASG